jgi:AcrR family transcriptional regulator
MTSTASSSLTKAVSEFPHERLLRAAAKVFARDGLTGATTREIAREAGVNEVTLFRLFHTKLNLLAMVIERVFASQEHPQSSGSRAPSLEMCLAEEMRLTEIVQEYAENYSAILGKNVALVRVLVGEIQHFQEHAQMVMRCIILPDRQSLIDRLRAAREAGLVRRELDPVIIADQVGALVFMGALRSSLPSPPEYSASSYLRACVEMIVRAIEEPPEAQPPASAPQFTPPSL